MKNFKLDDYPKISSGFNTPEHYFDHLPDQIFNQLKLNEPKVIPLFKRQKLWMASAAAILIIAVSIPIYNSLNPMNEEIDTTSMENYISYQSNISQYDLVNLLDEKDVDAIDLDIKVEDNTIEEVLATNSNFENYIID